MKTKQRRQYHIRNWGQCNQALVQRGSLTMWVDEAALAGWRNQEKSGGRQDEAQEESALAEIAIHSGMNPKEWVAAAR